MTDTVNKPRISRWIGRGYIRIVLFLIGLYGAIVVLTGILDMTLAGIFFTAVMLFAVLLVCVIAYCFFGTVYTIKEGHLHSWSPFTTIDLDIRDITKKEMTRVPIYFKGSEAYLRDCSSSQRSAGPK